MYYNNHKLKNVSSFTYLGVTLSSNGKFFQAQKTLAEQGMRALFSLNSLFDRISLGITEKLKLFDSMVMPILNYGTEVWGIHKGPDIERVYLKFLKQILCVRPQTSNIAVYGEVGRTPLYILRQERILRYYYKIINNPESIMFKLVQNYMVQRYNYGWMAHVKKLLDDLGFSYLWNNLDFSRSQLNMLIQRLNDQYLQSWFVEISESPKLCTYQKFKTEFVSEKYLNCVTNIKQRIALTRFRCSAHRLMIEEGRYRNIIRNERICTRCNLNVVEDEFHFLIVCPFYSELRDSCLDIYYYFLPDINKFTLLISSNDANTIRNVAKFIHLANTKRDNTPLPL